MDKGIDCVLYVNTSGDYDAPTWTEADCIRDFKQTVSWNKGPAGTRKSRVNKSVKTTLDLSWSGSFENDGSAAAVAIKAATLSDDPLDLLILNGPLDEDGRDGFRVDCQVFKADQDQGRESVIYPEIDIEPTPSDHEPKAVLISGGVPVYSDIAA